MKTQTTLIATLLAAHLMLAPSAGGAPAATRVYYIGNSLTDALRYDAFAELAAAGGTPVVWGRTMTPGAPIYFFWSRPGEGMSKPPFGVWDKALREYEWDALTLQVGNNPNFAGQFECADKFLKLALEKSPKLQVYVYSTWPGCRRGAAFERAFTEADPRVGRATDAPFAYQSWVEKMPAELRDRYRAESPRNRAEVQVRGMRALQPAASAPVKLIPATHVLMLLNQKMRAGRVPGFDSVWHLFSDGLHLNNAGSYLVGLTFYAAIFGKTPVGLPVGGYQGNPGTAGHAVAIAPAVARVFQETVWEVVASHPLTGVTAPDPLRVASPALDPAVAGESYAFELWPAFGQAPHTWRVAQGQLPDGLTLAPTGRIAGRPTTAGTAPLTIAVTDAAGAAATADLSLVVEAPVAPVIPAQQLPKLAVGTFIEPRLTSTAGNGDHTWQVPAGSALPPGLHLDSDGRLWGSPGKAGRFDFTLEVADGKRDNPGVARRAFVAEVGPPATEIAFARRLAAEPDRDDTKRLDPAQWQLRYPLKKLVQGATATVAGAFDAAWTDAALYVAVRVDDPNATPGGDGAALAGDNVVVCLDGLNNREAIYNADDLFLVLPRGARGLSRALTIGDRMKVNGEQRELEGGYFALFRIANRAAWDQPLAAHQVVGLDVMLVDDAQQGGAKSTVVWQGTKDNATDPSRFGTVVLSEGDKPSSEKK